MNRTNRYLESVSVTKIGLDEMADISFGRRECKREIFRFARRKIGLVIPMERDNDLRIFDREDDSFLLAVRFERATGFIEFTVLERITIPVDPTIIIDRYE